jgi:hypothetical protein
MESNFGASGRSVLLDIISIPVHENLNFCLKNNFYYTEIDLNLPATFSGPWVDSASNRNLQGIFPGG